MRGNAHVRFGGRAGETDRRRRRHRAPARPNLGGAALDVVRRSHWNQLRAAADPTLARRFKGARWALLRNPDNLSDRQADSLAAIRRTGGAVWRAYQLKEALRAVFAGDLPEPDVIELLDRWCSRAQRSRLPAFVTLGRTIRAHRDGKAAAALVMLVCGPTTLLLPHEK